MKTNIWLLLFLSCALLGGCATQYSKINLTDEDFVGKPISVVNNIPFEEQTPQLCGPTALYMAAKNEQPNLTLKEVTELTFTPAANGSFKQDMLAGSRRLNMAPYKVEGLPNIFAQLAQRHPIIIFHRTTFLWKNFWHYSVLTGYNKSNETFTLHIGPYANKEASISDVIGSWKEGGSWAYIVLPPNQIPETATFQETLDNALAFLRLGYQNSAHQLASEMAHKWPERYEVDLVLADAQMKKNEKENALQSLKRALVKKPNHLALKKKIRELSRAL